MPLYAYFNVAIELVAVIFGTYFLEKLESKFLYLYAFVCVAFVTELFITISPTFGLKNNLLVSHIYFPLEFLLLFLVYLKEFQFTSYRKLFVVLSPVFMIYCVVNPFFIQEVTEFSDVRSISSILLVLFSIMYYHKVMVEAKVLKLRNEPMVWVNTAILFYFSTGLFYNILFNLILEDSREFLKLTTWYFGVSNVSFYLLIAIGFYKAGKVQTNTV